MKCRSALGPLVVLVCCGCQAERFPVAPASGIVLFNGKPLAGAHVLFQPEGKAGEVEAGPESVGRTDAEGRFTLSTISPQRNGAMIGKHRVSVTIPEEESRYGGGGESGITFTGRPKYTLPERYRFGTELVVEVPAGGTDKIELVLKSP
jgi:hypothetical protein